MHSQSFVDHVKLYLDIENKASACVCTCRLTHSDLFDFLQVIEHQNLVKLTMFFNDLNFDSYINIAVQTICPS